MKAKRVLLGLLIAGLVVVGLSGVVWGDEWTSKTDVDGSSLPSPPPSGSVTVKIHIRTWALLYFDTNQVTLEDLTADKVSADTASATPGVTIEPLNQESPSGGSLLIAATNFNSPWCVKAQVTNDDGLYGTFDIYNGNEGTEGDGDGLGLNQWIEDISSEKSIVEKNSKGVLWRRGVKFRYNPTVDDTYKSGEDYTPSVKLTLTTP